MTLGLPGDGSERWLGGSSFRHGRQLSPKIVTFPTVDFSSDCESYLVRNFRIFVVSLFVTFVYLFVTCSYLSAGEVGRPTPGSHLLGPLGPRSSFGRPGLGPNSSKYAGEGGSGPRGIGRRSPLPPLQAGPLFLPLPAALTSAPGFAPGVIRRLFGGIRERFGDQIARAAVLASYRRQLSQHPGAPPPAARKGRRSEIPVARSGMLALREGVWVGPWADEHSLCCSGLPSSALGRLLPALFGLVAAKRDKYIDVGPTLSLDRLTPSAPRPTPAQCATA